MIGRGVPGAARQAALFGRQLAPTERRRYRRRPLHFGRDDRGGRAVCGGEASARLLLPGLAHRSEVLGA